MKFLNKDHSGELFVDSGNTRIPFAGHGKKPFEVGDIVSPKDGSFSLEFSGGCFSHTYVADPRGRTAWRVIATGCSLPADPFRGVSGKHEMEKPNDTIITAVNDASRIAFIRNDFLEAACWGN